MLNLQIFHNLINMAKGKKMTKSKQSTQQSNSGEPLSTTTEIKNGQSSSSSQSDGDSNNENLKIQSTTQSPLLSRQPTSSTTENKNVGSPNIPQSVVHNLMEIATMKISKFNQQYNHHYYLDQPTSSTTEIKMLNLQIFHNLDQHGKREEDDEVENRKYNNNQILVNLFHYH
ncbi:hypothetical protein EWB00_008220 [Schistosoma japonicum]|uniref:Uncharacterized protein n=1 Tax=Schistosoma japonicum TaxID=6182 RepID=A0A4Z2CR52_SCHJA|nr:hypothetical protein EWB00_008220 [Schistosoma japonicum]